MKSVVHSFAMCVPERKVTNQDLSKLMDTSDQWIVQRTGIHSRRWVDAPTTTSDLGAYAARKSLACSSEVPGKRDVDAVIAATLSADYSFPGIGVSIQHKLGLPTVPAFDVRNQCSGFLYGLEMADALVRVGTYRRILLVGAEVHSTGLDISTRGRDIAVLFGDGAGSCIVEGVDEHATVNLPGAFEILGTELHSDGAFVADLWCEHPGSAHFPTRITDDLVAEGKFFPLMNGRRVFEHAVKRMTEVSLSLLARHGMSASDISLFIPHQANLRINSMVAAQLGLQEEQVWNTIQEYGNTTAATIPIGISCARAANKIAPGQVILSAAFGSGFTWGAALLRAAS